MQSRLRMVALSITCRHKGCGRRAGDPCPTTHGRFHLVRYNDARRMISDAMKIEDWRRRYGKESA